MAEGNRRQDQIHGAAETMRRGTQDAMKGGAEVISQASKATARQGDAALEASARQASEAMARGAEVAQRSGAEIARRAEAMEAGGRQLAQGAIQAGVQGLAEGTAQGNAQMQAALQPAMAGMMALPQAFAGLLGDMARAQWQIGQDMFRLTNPLALMEMQQRMLQGYLDLILAGQAKLDRTTRDAEATMPGRLGA